jgi:hypothetical protein
MKPKPLASLNHLTVPLSVLDSESDITTGSRKKTTVEKTYHIQIRLQERCLRSASITMQFEIREWSEGIQVFLKHLDLILASAMRLSCLK